MPVWVADRRVYVNTKGTQTVKICTAQHQQGVYEWYYRIDPPQVLTQREMENAVARFLSIQDLELWLMQDRLARRERDKETRPDRPEERLPVEEGFDLPDEEEDAMEEGPELTDATVFLQTADRQTAIDSFIRWCDQPHVDYFDLSSGRSDEIANHYFTGIRQLSDEGVFQILGIMVNWINYQTEVTKRTRRHIPVDEWKGCCTGVADILLRPKDIDGTARIAAASVLQRLSGWYHTGIPLWHAFRLPARSIGDILCGQGVLHYLKIGEEWLCDSARLDPANVQLGRMNLWHFAEGVPNSVRRDPKASDETRTPASRLLNSLCREDYPVKVFEDQYQVILSHFPPDNPWVLPRPGTRDRENHPLLRWSIDNDFVDMLTKKIIVPTGELLDFLRRTGFNPDITYKPGAEKRLSWFRRWERIQRQL